jgi:hypothetical protein
MQAQPELCDALTCGGPRLQANIKGTTTIKLPFAVTILQAHTFAPGDLLLDAAQRPHLALVAVDCIMWREFLSSRAKTSH